MNKNKLRAVLADHGENQRILADALGKSRVTLSRKLNEKKQTKGFSQPEISAIVKRCDLMQEQIADIFLRIRYLKKIQKQGRSHG